MVVEFEIEFVSEDANKSGAHVLARMLNSKDTFQFTDTLALDGAGIKAFQIPRALDEEGKLRRDLFAFLLKDKSELSRFAVGKIVKLT